MIMERDFFEEIYSSDSRDDLKLIKDNELVVFARDLVKNYEIGDFIIKAVDHVSLEIKRGEFIVIKGHSGAGKTTLLNLIGGLDLPDQGIIYYDGVLITSMNEESLATFRLMNSGFIFQNYNLISTLTAEENIMFPMSLAGVSLKDQRERALNLLLKIGLGDRREHLPFQLSAGEQQRVAIARALANKPPNILADEPTANLDNKTSIFIQRLFKELKEEGTTIIIASHDDGLIELADRIILFEEGKILNNT